MTEHYRTFDTGATRDTDEGKLDFEGFLSPLVIEAFAKYMHAKRQMPDGSVRDSDNWQKGIPFDAYMKSMWRHFFAVWASHRKGWPDTGAEEELLALLFNVQGYLHERLKAKKSHRGGKSHFVGCAEGAQPYARGELGSAWFNYGV